MIYMQHDSALRSVKDVVRHLFQIRVQQYLPELKAAVSTHHQIHRLPRTVLELGNQQETIRDNKLIAATYTDPYELFMFLNTIGGEHGCGRLDIVENRFIGMKSRGCYETPAGTILFQSHLDLETLTLDREVMRIRDTLSIKFAELVYNGYWFAPEMQFLLNAMEDAQKPVSGSVFVQLHKGNVIMRGRESAYSLYNEDLVSMDKEGGFDASISTGFIQTLSTRIKASAAREKIMNSAPAEAQ